MSQMAQDACAIVVKVNGIGIRRGNPQGALMVHTYY